MASGEEWEGVVALVVASNVVSWDQQRGAGGDIPHTRTAMTAGGKGTPSTLHGTPQALPKEGSRRVCEKFAAAYLAPLMGSRDSSLLTLAQLRAQSSHPKLACFSKVSVGAGERYVS